MGRRRVFPVQEKNCVPFYSSAYSRPWRLLLPRPRYLRISSEQWVSGRRNEYFDDSVSRSQVCRKIASDYLRSLRHH
jgi:hypothetical protein